MPVMGLLPEDVPDVRGGKFLTFVVPASHGGCNLNCSHCLVRQRQEISTTHLKPADLSRFIHQAARRSPIYALALQGYEPLLPASREYTQAVLSAGQLLNIPTTLVTNGICLKDAANWLAVLSPNFIAVSIDAATPDAHDRIRGVKGAWTATVEGVAHAVEMLMPRTRVAVASVLTAHREPLDGMPALLRDLGVDHWIISPLQKVGREQAGGPAGNRDKLYRNLLILQRAADEAGIRMIVDDELDNLQHRAAIDRNPELAKLNVRTLPTGINLFRLVPSGHISMNHDILTQVSPHTERWQPDRMDAGDLLADLEYRADTRQQAAA